MQTPSVAGVSGGKIQFNKQSEIFDRGNEAVSWREAKNPDPWGFLCDDVKGIAGIFQFIASQR
jgi:hypothetical protein